MKKKTVVLGASILALALTIGSVLYFHAGFGTILKGVVLQAEMGYVVLRQMMDDGTLTNNTYRIPLNRAPKDYEPVCGDVLEVRYNGQETRSIPAQLGGIASVQVLERGIPEETEEPAMTAGEAVWLNYSDGSVRFTLPKGWCFEGNPEDKKGNSQLLCRFGREEGAMLRLSYERSFGMCGTGVTSEKLESDQGYVIWKHTESSNECVFLTIVISDEVNKKEDCMVLTGSMSRSSYESCIDAVEQLVKGIVIE